jgi:hypothetical protein
MASKEVTQNDGWMRVSSDEVDETKIVFDTLGDEFIGEYIGQRSLKNDDGEYTQLRFRNDDGELFFTNANYSLKNSFSKIRPGRTVRITFTDEKDVGQRSPLKIFTVDVRR